MVGAPKHLRDLAKIEADVRITCRKCGFEVDWRVADLSAHLIMIGGNLTWSEITRHLVCRRQGCGSTRLRAAAVPFPSLAAARRIIEAWRTDYNTVRPHSSLGGMAPADFTNRPRKGQEDTKANLSAA